MRQVLMAVTLALLGGTVIAVDPPAPVAAVATQDGVWLDQCESIVWFDALCDKYRIDVVLNYEMLAGGVIYAYAWDADNSEWYVLDPVLGVSMAGNKKGRLTLDKRVALNTDFARYLAKKKPLFVHVKLVPAGQAPAVSHQDYIYWPQD